METQSVEDKGDLISFTVFCYNSQPGITIDYATGVSKLSGEPATPQEASASEPVRDTATSAQVILDAAEQTYILNTDTHKFHLPTCSSVKQISESNKKSVTGSRDTLMSEEYEPCKRCNPSY